MTLFVRTPTTRLLRLVRKNLKKHWNPAHSYFSATHATPPGLLPKKKSPSFESSSPRFRPRTHRCDGEHHRAESQDGGSLSTCWGRETPTNHSELGQDVARRMDDRGRRGKRLCLPRHQQGRPGLWQRADGECNLVHRPGVAAEIGVPRLAPHDLRRTCAKLCRAAGGDLEQIQLLLGHASIATTERYLGSRLDLVDAVNDDLGLNLP